MSDFRLSELLVSPILEKALLFTIFFPYIPGILPADTQPWFLLFFLLLFFVQIVSVDQKLSVLGISNSIQTKLIGVLCLGVVFSIVSQVIISGIPQISRIISFCQFLVALVYGQRLASKSVDENLFFIINVIYLFFTGVFFITNGALENLLVFRQVDTDLMMSTGRGARTLSGEPSFFALTILNIYIIRKILYPQTTFSKKKDFLFFFISVVNMILSFSGIGLVIAFVLIVSYYPLIIVYGIVLLPLIIPILYNYIEKSSVRAFVLLRFVLEGRGSILIDSNNVYGQSFGTRFNSFLYYWESFVSSPILGGGFIEPNKNGGLISFLAEIGMGFLLLMIAAVRSIFIGKYQIGFKGLLFFWLLLRMLSGAMGIPGVGIIIGLMLSIRK